MDRESARGLLIRVLRHAHAGELAAGHAYRGHAASVSDPGEKARIRRIEDEEWVHRRQVGEMLASLGEAPDPAQERKLFLIGKTIAVLCRIGGWYVPMYGAGRLESHNVKEYEDAADFAVDSGHPEFVECLLEMAEVEWDHEAYFRGKVEGHWLRHVITVWPPIPPKDAIRSDFARRNPGYVAPVREPLAVSIGGCTMKNGMRLQVGTGWMFMILMATLARAASPTLEPRSGGQPTPGDEQTDRAEPGAFRLSAKPSRIGPGDVFSVMGTDFGGSAKGRKLYLEVPQATDRPDRIPLKVVRWTNEALQVQAPRKMPPPTGSVHLVLVDKKQRVLGRCSVVLIKDPSSVGAKDGLSDREIDIGRLEQGHDRGATAGGKGQVDVGGGGGVGRGQADDGALPGQLGSTGPDRGTPIPHDRRNPMPHRPALVLSGGGAKGAFQLGVLKYLYEQRQFSPSIITGASVGALNAAKLAEGPGAIRQLEQLWRGIRGNQDVYDSNPAVLALEKRIEKDIEEMKEGIGHLFLATFLFPPTYAVDFVYDSLGDPYTLDHWLRQVDGIESLNVQNGLYRLIRDYLNPDSVRLSGIKLSVATVTRDGGELRYVNELGQIHDASGTRLNAGWSAEGFITIQRGVRASSAIPLVFKPELIDGEYYWDGAIREDVPVRRALQLGATDLTIILCSPRKYRPAPLSGLPSGAAIKPITNAMHVMDILADQVAQDDLSSVLGVLDVLHEIGWNALRNDLSRVQSFPLPRDQNEMVFSIPSYKVIEPPVVVGSITDFLPEVIDANIRLGEMVARFSYSERRDAAAEQREIRALLSAPAEAYRRQYEATRRVAEGGEHGPRKMLTPRIARAFRLWRAFEGALKEYDDSLARRAR